jgi:hypothetical protein
MLLFDGLDRVHGEYDMSRPAVAENGKRTGVVVTKPGPVTYDMWERHLAGGEPGIGVVPIRDGDDCVFGAIDVDVYPVSHQDIVVKLNRFNLPLIVCRTKSGGAHLYCFAIESVSAEKMRSKLSEIASLLGLGKHEIFPKQSHLLTDSGDCGSWLNICYHGGVRGMRFAVGLNGDALTPDQFIEAALAARCTAEWFTKKVVIDEAFSDGPPCLQVLSQLGFPEGTRNDGLFQIGVYMRKAFPDNWEPKIEDANHKFMEPPLHAPDINGVIKSLKKKDYAFKCKNAPFLDHCNAALCRTRKFGVGGGGQFPILGGLAKLTTTPPIWFWTVEGVRMELATEEIQDPRRFQKRCMEKLNMMPQMPSAPVWQAAVQHAMDTIATIEAPPDASPEGQFWEMVQKFCTGRQALNLDEIVLGKPYTDGGRTYFKMEGLLAYLQRHKFQYFTTPKMSSMLKEAGAQHHAKNLRMRCTQYWSLAEFTTEEESLRVPSSVKKDAPPF